MNLDSRLYLGFSRAYLLRALPDMSPDGGSAVFRHAGEIWIIYRHGDRFALYSEDGPLSTRLFHGRVNSPQIAVEYMRLWAKNREAER